MVSREIGPTGQARDGLKFGGVLCGDAAIRSGYYVLTFALPIIVLHQADPRAPMLSGIVAAAFYWPMWLLSSVAGGLVDRFGERRVIGLVGVLRSVAVGMLVGALVLNASAWFIVGVALALGASAAVHDVAVQTVPGRFLESRSLNSANGKLQAIASVTRTAGPAIAGVALTALGHVLSAMSTLIFVTLGAIVLTRSLPSGASQPSGWRPLSLAAALREIRHNRPVLLTCVLSALYNGVSQAFQVVLLVHLVQDRQYSDLTVGFVVGVAGIGVVLGSWLAGRREVQPLLRGPRLVAWALRDCCTYR